MGVEPGKRSHEPLVLAKMVGDAYRWIINDPRPPLSYTDAWRDLHKRLRLLWLLILGFAPGALLSGLMLDAIHPGPGDCVWTVIPWVAALLAAGFYWKLFRCPRCGELFFGAFLFGFFDLFRQKCRYCGLHKWESSGAPKTSN